MKVCSDSVSAIFSTDACFPYRVRLAYRTGRARNPCLTCMPLRYASLGIAQPQIIFWRHHNYAIAGFFPVLNHLDFLFLRHAPPRHHHL
jgi:hypothetical protein